MVGRLGWNLWCWVSLALLLLGAPAQAGGVDGPQVDGRVMEVGVYRHRGTLWRFVRFNTESDFPCLRFEAISPERGWQVRASQDICRVELSNAEILDFRETAYTGFSSVTFDHEQSQFEFAVEYMRRSAAGEQVVNCTLPTEVQDGFGSLSCR